MQGEEVVAGAPLPKQTCADDGNTEGWFTNALPVYVSCALALVIAAVALVIGLWRRKKDEGGSIVQSLDETIRILQETVKHQQAQISAIWASQSVVFTVVQYNILASYLGDNKQPWFMYGLPEGAMPESRRAAIMSKFYERGPDGKYCNIGWPNYVEGLLTEEEKEQIVSVHEKFFAWEARGERLFETVIRTNADLISLVELDLYESFWKPRMEAAGYSSAYRKRPRAASADGCGIFWRSNLFTLLGAACRSARLPSWPAAR